MWENRDNTGDDDAGNHDSGSESARIDPWSQVSSCVTMIIWSRAIIIVILSASAPRIIEFSDEM